MSAAVEMTGEFTEADTERELSATREKVANLEAALTTSRMIGAAVGIAMERRKLDMDVAFRLLVVHSQRTNRKLRDVAEDVVYTGVVPPLTEEGHPTVGTRGVSRAAHGVAFGANSVTAQRLCVRVRPPSVLAS